MRISYVNFGVRWICSLKKCSCFPKIFLDHVYLLWTHPIYAKVSCKFEHFSPFPQIVLKFLWKSFLKIMFIKSSVTVFFKISTIFSKFSDGFDYSSANFFQTLCRLYTLASCIWRESRTRVVRDKTGWVRLSILLPRAVNPREARARRGPTDESESKEIFVKYTVADVPANRSKFWFFLDVLGFFSKCWWIFQKLRPTFPMLPDECRHKAPARRDTRPFDSCTTDC